MLLRSSISRTGSAGCTDCVAKAPLLNRALEQTRRPIFSLLMLAAEHGRLPDVALRMGIRRLLQNRLRELQSKNHVLRSETERVDQFLAETFSQPIAVATRLANEQHYEVPAEFFQSVLGPNLKYSSGYWHAKALISNKRHPKGQWHTLCANKTDVLSAWRALPSALDHSKSKLPPVSSSCSFARIASSICLVAPSHGLRKKERPSAS